MKKNLKIAAQGGFTLIELIVVIVILGILAATALPKFADLGNDARVASLKAAKGSLSSAMAITHGQALVSSSASAATGSVTLEGVAVSMAYGYPTAASIATAAGISADDYTVTKDNDTTPTKITVSPKGIAATAISSCSVVYTAATSLTAPATVVLQTGTTGSGSTQTANPNPICS